MEMPTKRSKNPSGFVTLISTVSRMPLSEAFIMMGTIDDALKGVSLSGKSITILGGWLSLTAKLMEAFAILPKVSLADHFTVWVPLLKVLL